LARYDRIYIRFRGRTLGPITQIKAEDLIRRHQITKQHELSADSVSWRPADELFPDVFNELSEESGEGEANKPATTQPVTAVPVEVQWFAIIDGTQQGPVPELTLRTWIANGSVRPDTPIWREGLQQFIEAEKVRPEWFFKPSAATHDEETAEEMPPALARVCNSLLISRKWTFLFGVAGLTISILALVGSTWMLLSTISQSERNPVILGRMLQHLATIVQTISLITGFVLVLRYAQSLTPLRFAPTEARIGIALQRLTHVWMFAGIAAIVFSCLFCLMILIAMVVDT
jgi:hypothetical protein